MHTYAILRRDLATPENLEDVAARSARELANRPDTVRRIRTYLIKQDNGQLGTICIYQASDPESITEHGRAAGIAVDEVLPITAIEVERPDPDVIE
jgi:Protein of unknown function (DUF4242)